MGLGGTMRGSRCQHLLAQAAIALQLTLGLIQPGGFAHRFCLLAFRIRNGLAYTANLGYGGPNRSAQSGADRSADDEGTIARCDRGE